jgi:UDP-N-acetylmuramate--alanine ligase
MLASLLIEASYDPTVVLGAAPLGKQGGGRAGRGRLLVVEACEYRANFLHLAPQQAAILGIEPDHFDCYPSPDQLHEAFARFARRLPSRGLLLTPHDCRVSRKTAAQAGCRTATFGFQAAADWAALNLDGHTAGRTPHALREGVRHAERDEYDSCETYLFSDPCGCSSVSPGGHARVAFDGQRGQYAFDLVHLGRKLARVRLRVQGAHNVANALAAAALAWENGVGPELIVRGLERFAGLRRRLEWRGCWRGVTLLDDYAHHPTEVSATLRAVREMYPGRRVWCVFQPHQASRTAHLLDELAASLQNADRVFVAEIFRAREPSPRPGEVTAADLAQRIRLPESEVPDAHDTELIFRLLETRLAPGDVLITMGAGDIWKLSNAFVDRFRQDRAAG